MDTYPNVAIEFDESASRVKPRIMVHYGHMSSMQHPSYIPGYFSCYLPACICYFLSGTVAEADVEQETSAISGLIFGLPNSF